MENILLECLLRFRGVPRSITLFLFSLLLTLPLISSNNIQTVNEIPRSRLNNTRIYSQITELGENETFPGTFSLCPNVSDTKLVNRIPLPERYDYLQVLRGMNSVSFDVQPDFFMRQFQTFLELKEFVSHHKLAIKISNQSVAELQDALTYAWLPRLAKSNWTATRAEILRIENGTRFSTDGSALMLIRYMLPVSDAFSPANFSRNQPQYPWLYARNSTYHELTQIVTPPLDEFIQRLQDKGVTAYNGPLFFETTGILDDVYLRANSTYGFFDTDQMKTDVMEMVQQTRARKNCSDGGMSDVEIHFGGLEPQIVTSRTNGTFSDVTVMPIQLAIHVQQRTLVSDRFDGFPLPIHTDRYYFDSESVRRRVNINTTGLHLLDQLPLNPAHSFRMHLGRPLNVQWLPLLETLMTSQLNTSIGPHHRAEVRVWNFDPDGWVVNFFVILRSEPMLWLGYVLDARLPYAASIYRKLEGLQLRLPSASAVYMLMTYVVDDISKRVVRERAFRDCEGEDKWLSFPVEEQECPLQKNFTLYVEWLSEYPHRRYLQNGFVKVQPNADKILDAVQQAFAIANPVTMDNIVLTISLTDRDDSLRTTIGRDAFKLSFALSYPKMKSGLYWKLWRYPSYDELNGLLQSVAEVKLVRTWTVAIPVSN